MRYRRSAASGTGIDTDLRFSAHAKRAIISWRVVYLALHEHGEVADRDDFSDLCFQGLEAWLDSRCQLQIGSADDQTPVEEFLGGLVDDLASEIDARVGNRDQATQDAFTRLAQHVRARVVEYQKSPHDPLAVLDAWARGTTIASYQDQPDASVATEIQARLGDVQTAVIVAFGLPPGAIAPWRVHGLARFPVNGGPVWRVELTLGVPPDPPSWSAISYVLLHEYISHAAQGPWTNACKQPVPDDAFAEGWMDVVTHLLHGLNVYGAGVTDPIDDPADRVLAAATFYYERSRTRRRGTRQRRHGYIVGENFHRRLLEAQDGPVDETFVRLSLQLNASAASHEQRQAFVWGIEAGYATGEPIDDWIVDYRADGDLKRLLDRVVSIAHASSGRSALGS